MNFCWACLKGSLAQLFKKLSPSLPGKVLGALERAGVRPAYLLDGSGSMLSDAVNPARLEVMKRHAAHLLKVIVKSSQALNDPHCQAGLTLHVTDSQNEPASIEAELISLLIEALQDKSSRERLVQFIRS